MSNGKAGDARRSRRAKETDFHREVVPAEMPHQMAIRKHEFYEGAAIHQLIRAGDSQCIVHEPPFFILNGKVATYLKYCTRSRSPWSFTFTSEEQIALATRAAESLLYLGLVCGQDGIAAVAFEHFALLASLRDSSIHIACYRKHNEHYAVSGPDGELKHKISPSRWRRLMEESSESL